MIVDIQLKSFTSVVGDSNARRRLRWRWIAALLIAGALLSATLELVAAQADSDDKGLMPGMLEHLGDVGRVYLADTDLALTPGNAEWKEGRPEAAIQEWSKVAASYGRSERGLPALANIGRAASSSGDRKGAIAAYKQLVEIPAAPPKVLDVEYKHHACVELSDLYLEVHDPVSALRYAELALNTHHSSDWCGMATMSKNSWLEERITAIKSALARGRPISIEPRTTALARFLDEGRRVVPSSK